ncbi:hypothetical protein KBTX_02227 [wastewater metagenome]|uniref:ABC transporter permease n=2 Tax=unclassified sequences TaxID=12908 RepID=A0A5B8R9N6_9ZZZZ|nr:MULTISPECIES: Gldg family protein [Arhodomonas]QEA05899.1 hypothetical protein KBTEX_02227 [uncultured organism]
MRGIRQIFRREAGLLFGASAAYLFIGAFLAVSLFVVFWVEAFFARGIADLRPLFEWMPLLLIALVAAVTMRAWSEERRAGTMEVLLGTPVASPALVAGKFLAALLLVATALALTLPLAVTVAWLGPLDPGPVIGGYVATLALAAAYLAMGLFVSARTDNPMVALIATVLLTGGFYLVGSDWLTALFPAPTAAAMRLIGTGARFEAISRGVLDLRDLYYYLSLTATFLALNVLGIERLRWAGAGGSRRRAGAWYAVTALIAANCLIANAWLQPVATARADLTAGHRYTLSAASRDQLAGLDGPLVIRGYFSGRTHPLLAPLVPQLRDLLDEYARAGDVRVSVDTVDPQTNASLARRIREDYGIEPVSLKSANRYESSVVSAYFHVLVRYGGEHVVLDYHDLVAIKGGRGGDVRVTLRNPEYALTSAIRKVRRRARHNGNPFTGLDAPVTFHGYVSPAAGLPGPLATLRGSLEDILADLRRRSDGRLRVSFDNPQAGDGTLARRLRDEYGFRAMTTRANRDNSFYFYMVLEQNGRTVTVDLPRDLEPDTLRKAIESGIRRFDARQQRTIAVYRPPRGLRARLGTGGRTYRTLLQRLEQHATVARTDLRDGRVPTGTDLLLVLSPRGLDERQRFAIDQFLMTGGTVIVAGSRRPVLVSAKDGLSVQPGDTGLAAWLAHNGVSVSDRFVLDPQSGSLTLPSRRNGEVSMRTMDYPLFVDVRGDGLADVPALGNLRQVTMAWSAPVHVDTAKARGLSVTPLVQSSSRAWTSGERALLPDYDAHPLLGFPQPRDRGRRTLGIMLQGRFTSAFDDPPAPGPDDNGAAGATPLIDHSPAGTRLVVFGGSNFLTDSALDIMARSMETQYLQPVTMAQNLVEASLADPALIALRGRNRFSRLLRPMSDETRRLVEYGNYAAALAGLLLVLVVQRAAAWRRRRRLRRILTEEG